MSTQFELRQSADRKTWTLDGYASRTGVRYKVHDHRGSYTEVIEPGAFRSTLSAGADVVLCAEHQPPFVARTPRTLKLTEDDRGLHVKATMDHDDPDVRALVSKVRNGIFGEMSMAFRAPDWDGSPTRSIRTLSLDGGDVSVVRRGSNRSTEVSVRGRPAGTFEVRSSGLIALRQEDGEDHDLMTCPQCDGDGTLSDGRICPACGGTGQVPAEDDEDDGRSARLDFTDAQKSGSRSAPSVADLERRALVARSQAAEARFEATYGDQLAQMEAAHLTHCGRLADEALRRGDTRSAAMWVRQEIVELEGRSMGL